MSRDNLLITMSGGTTSVINATLAGIVETSVRTGAISRVYAGSPGIVGALNESMVDLTDLTCRELRRLCYTPASGFVGTTRVAVLGEHEVARLTAVLSAYDIGYFVNIGGNGTVKQSIQLARHLSGDVRMAAAPKTVDNDLGDPAFERMLFTPGFPSCANYWRHKVWIMNQENMGACSHDKVLIAQTFGRKTGFLAGCARLADKHRDIPLMILLPEDQRPIESVLARIENTVADHGRAMVVISEGYDVGDLGERYDPTGQVMYGTSRTTAAQLLVNHCADIGIQGRAFVPGFDQRSDISFVSPMDIQTAFKLGVNIMERLVAGESGFLACVRRPDNGADFSYIAVPFAECQGYSRSMPARWISKGAFDVTDAYVNYVEPLIGPVPAELPRIGWQYDFAVQPLPCQGRKLPLWQPDNGIVGKAGRLLNNTYMPVAHG